jgi:ParB/RepB/Spo0J family partition protein
MSKLEDRIAAVRGSHAVSFAPQPSTDVLPPDVTSLVLSREPHADPDSLVLFINQIHVGMQARKRFHHIDELAADIKERGLLQPIVVRELSPHRYLLLSGERRLRAVRDVLKQDMIIARLIRTASDERAWRLSQLAENLQREAYEPLELAREFAALKEHFGYSDASLAEALQVSRTWVWKQLSLLSAPVDVQAAIDDGRLAATDYLNNKALYAEGGDASPTHQQRAANSDPDGMDKRNRSSASRDSVTRIPTTAVPTPSLMEVATLLKVLAEQHALSPITLSVKPAKCELLAIITTRTPEILQQLKQRGEHLSSSQGHRAADS